mmetsp:Transcript_21868/g.37693  ORF Transcript_21868/g.37693 Transcript_21868/m.37693 type:complete len:98 (-) Transcript_21868:885-1178(-)
MPNVWFEQPRKTTFRLSAQLPSMERQRNLEMLVETNTVHQSTEDDKATKSCVYSRHFLPDTANKLRTYRIKIETKRKETNRTPPHEYLYQHGLVRIN